VFYDDRLPQQNVITTKHYAAPNISQNFQPYHYGLLQHVPTKKIWIKDGKLSILYHNKALQLA
jgi:hypothetical protein